MAELEVYADIVCPFAHVGLARWAARRDATGRTDVRLRVHAWPLETINGAPMDPDALAHKVAELRRQVAPDHFAGFDAAHVPTTSLPGLALTAAAYRVSLATGEAMALELRRLLFDEGRDISRPAVLDDAAERLGVPAVTEADRESVTADHRSGTARGVVGSPHFFLPDGSGAFCPSLEIRRDGDHLDIGFDRDRFDALVAASLA